MKTVEKKLILGKIFWFFGSVRGLFCFPNSARINAHIKATGYPLDESQRAIVIVDPEAVHLSKFKLSEKLDIFAIHTIQSEHKRRHLEGFRPANWASMQKVAVTEIEQSKYAYLILGTS